MADGTTTSPDEAEGAEVTYLLIDGENLDATLGLSLLGRRPASDERPRWDRVVAFVETTMGHPVTTLFFINASSGHMPMSFVQALTAKGIKPILLSGPPDVKVVDVGIQRTLESVARRQGDVVLGSHDGDFQPQVEALIGDGRRVGMLGFREYFSNKYAELVTAGLEMFDLEDDAHCFNVTLPRLRIVDIDAFDPEAYL